MNLPIEESDSRMDPMVLYMAPLKGFTDHVYRNTYARHFSGVDVSVAPFVAAGNGIKIGRKSTDDLLPERNLQMPVIPQILSRLPHGFLLLADHFFQLGYETVNWNLGCPYPMSAAKNRAAWLLPQPDLIQEFLEDVIPKMRGRISIKARLGLRDRQEFQRLIPILNRFPLQEVILHPRTGFQRYDGQPDLTAFEACLPEVNFPIVYNGDIRSMQDYQNLAERFPTVRRWMIGRGLLVNPFLPEEIRTGIRSTKDLTRKIKAFHDELFVQYDEIVHGPKQLLDRMKGLWRYFQLGFPGSEKGVEGIRSTRSPDAYQDAADLFFEQYEFHPLA